MDLWYLSPLTYMLIVVLYSMKLDADFSLKACCMYKLCYFSSFLVRYDPEKD